MATVDRLSYKWAPLAFLAAGVAVVLGLPALARLLPGGSVEWPSPAQAALTAAGILVGSVAYLQLAGRQAGLSTKWLGYAAGYNGAIAVIKFVLSPGSFRGTEGVGLGQYVTIGFVVMLFYAASIWAIWAVAKRNAAPRRWSVASKLALLLGIFLFAMGSRYLAAVAVGSGTYGYLEQIFVGSSLILPALLLVAIALAIQAFDAAGHPTDTGFAYAVLGRALGIGLSLIVVYHLLWAIFMFRLFG